MDQTIPTTMQQLIDEVKAAFDQDEKIGAMFAACFTNTLQTTMQTKEDGSTFVITGDIPAMWLRDSAAQVRPYLLLAEKDEQMADMIEGVINRQITYIQHDPYANAFNAEPSGARFNDDVTEMTPLIWERKYEIDSLCYPIQLAYLFWKATGRTSHLNASFTAAVRKIINTWQTEQDHEKLSSYRFERPGAPDSETLSRGGKGRPVAKTGMTWSGFRPSDDACTYGYLVPANMFALVVLHQLTEMARDILHDDDLASTASTLANEIEEGIETYGKVDHPEFGLMYAYEVDGFGNSMLMDDANVPSLLALPYLGYCQPDDPVYLNTRRFILSAGNPYFYEGSWAQGIGSPHTPERYIWHMALAIQGMTTSNEAEKKRILTLLKTTDAGTNLMHEGFHVDDPEQYTRPWFSWVNALASEFFLSLCGYDVKGSPLARTQLQSGGE